VNLKGNSAAIHSHLSRYPYDGRRLDPTPQRKTMKTFARIAIAAALAAPFALPSATAWAQDKPKKNWTVPAKKIYAQQLSDETMKKHPELLSVTLHGVPPGMTDVYTMFAGSYPERIGNPDDPDDIDVSKKGITILDPRWHRTKDTDKKFVVLMPMQDAKGENVGLVVYAFKNPPKMTGMEEHYLKESTKLRNDLAKKIPSYDKLFEPAK
jgi:hypothetical protein